MKLACAKLRTPQKLEAKVLKLFQAGISQNEIARQLNLGRNTVHRILVREKNH
jgi:DNA-binding NarL/FixJ family response regulator